LICAKSSFKIIVRCSTLFGALKGALIVVIAVGTVGIVTIGTVGIVTAGTVIVGAVTTEVIVVCEICAGACAEIKPASCDGGCD